MCKRERERGRETGKNNVRLHMAFEIVGKVVRRQLSRLLSLLPPWVLGSNTGHHTCTAGPFTWLAILPAQAPGRSNLMKLQEPSPETFYMHLVSLAHIVTVDARGPHRSTSSPSPPLQTGTNEQVDIKTVFKVFGRWDLGLCEHGTSTQALSCVLSPWVFGFIDTVWHIVQASLELFTILLPSLPLLGL